MNRIQADLIAVDVGNSFIKFGRFRHADSVPTPNHVPLPDMVIQCKLDDVPGRLRDWLPNEPCAWMVSSVNREIESKLSQWLASQRGDPYVLLQSRDVPIPIEVEFPERVGMDRLAAAVAANRLRGPNQPAIVVDAGSAITVDAVSRSGSFLGGAILPGLMMSAEALAADTDLLPLVPASYHDNPPAVLGRSTEAAMRSGLYWGTVGAVKEVVLRLVSQISDDALLIVSGGTAELLKDRLPLKSLHVPQLVLSGIAMIALSRNADCDTSDE